MRNSTPSLSSTLVSIALGLVVVVLASFALWKNNPSTPLPEKTTAAVSPTIDPLSGWETFTSDKFGFSFKYPPEFMAEERSEGFIVITSPQTAGPQAGISIDARQQDILRSLAETEAYIGETFTVNATNTVSQWITYRAIGKEGMLRGSKFIMAVAPYRSGAIKVEAIDADPFADLLPQVLRTFEFTGQD